MHHVGCMAGHESYVVHGSPELHVVQGAIKIKMYYVYILKSQRDGNSYIGYTTDL